MEAHSTSQREINSSMGGIKWHRSPFLDTPVRCLSLTSRVPTCALTDDVLGVEEYNGLLPPSPSGGDCQGPSGCWEMLLKALNLVCLFFPLSSGLQHPTVLFPPGQKVCWVRSIPDTSCTYHALTGYVPCSHTGTFLCIQMEPSFIKLGLLTQDHYHGKAERGEAVQQALPPFVFIATQR